MIDSEVSGSPLHRPPPALENRLAMQARLIARTGNCEGALATARRLSEIDPDSYARLLTDAAVARCL